jgi:hypothetical protein
MAQGFEDARQRRFRAAFSITITAEVRRDAELAAR